MNKHYTIMGILRQIEGSDSSSVVAATPETVTSAVVTEDRTLKVRFSPNDSKAEKAPKFRAVVELPAPMNGIVTELPIFKGDQGYSVMMPGGRFPSLRAANRRFAGADGKVYESTLKVEEGTAKIDALPSLVLSAFHAYITTGQADQVISLP